MLIFTKPSAVFFAHGSLQVPAIGFHGEPAVSGTGTGTGRMPCGRGGTESQAVSLIFYKITVSLLFPKNLTYFCPVNPIIGFYIW